MIIVYAILTPFPTSNTVRLRLCPKHKIYRLWFNPLNGFFPPSTGAPPPTGYFLMLVAMMYQTEFFILLPRPPPWRIQKEGHPHPPSSPSSLAPPSLPLGWQHGGSMWPILGLVVGHALFNIRAPVPTPAGVPFGKIPAEEAGEKSAIRIRSEFMNSRELKFVHFRRFLYTILDTKLKHSGEIR